MAFKFGGKTTTDGLVLYLDAANSRSYPGSGNTWYDLSKYGNDLTLSGSTPPIYSTNYNGSFNFNGSSSYATSQTKSSLSSTLSTVIVACTYKQVLAYGDSIVVKGQGGSGYNYGIANIRNNTFDAVNTSCANLAPTSSTWNTSSINIYAATWAGTYNEYYANGIYLGTNSTCYSPQLISSPVTVGASPAFLAGFTGYYSGSLSIVQIYNRALSSDEIIQNYNTLKPRFGL